MQNVVVAMDFSDLSQGALEQAALVAERFSSALWIVHVAAPDPDFVGFEVGPQTVRDSRAAELRKEHRALQDHATRLRQRGIEAHALLVQGPTVETLVGEARRLEADLLVLGSHGRGAVYRTLLGSISEGVLRRAPCPILIVPAPKSSNDP